MVHQGGTEPDCVADRFVIGDDAGQGQLDAEIPFRGFVQPVCQCLALLQGSDHVDGQHDGRRWLLAAQDLDQGVGVHDRSRFVGDNNQHFGGCGQE